MRDYTAVHSDYKDSYPVSRSRGWDGLQAVALIGAIALIATPVIVSMSRRWRIKPPAALSEPSIDKSLKDTYPASDPPASRYFDIPANRQ